MPTYALTGGLGSGKSLVATGRMQDYLRQGRKVATNFNLYLDKLLHPRSKMTCIRLPDFPSIEDFKAIGRGHYVPDPAKSGHYLKDEKHNGLIVLDECNVLFNARDWNKGGDRDEVISWLRHSRKLGWDVIFTMQSLEAFDRQIRIGLIEHEGVCKRSDRLSIPFIGGLFRFLGLGALSRPPRVHVCSVKYGIGSYAMVVDRWMYRGITVQNGYDTNQIFSVADSPGIHTMLPPMLTHGRYLPPLPWVRFRLWLNGNPWRPAVNHKPKLPLVERIQKLPVEKRLEFYRRFEVTGAFEVKPCGS